MNRPIAYFTALFLLLPALVPAQTPASWPGSGSNSSTPWVAYRDSNGNPIQDPNDMTPNHLDIVTSPADPASVYVAFDGSTTFYRFQLEASPIAGNGTWSNGTWIVQFGSASTGVIGSAYVNVNGQVGNIAVTDGSNTDIIYSFNANQSNPSGARVTAVSNATTFYLDFQIPLSALYSGTNVHLGLTPASLISFYYGTSTASGNPSQISKDFMIGASVDFNNLQPSEFNLIGGGMLPVELTAFSAYRKDDIVFLRWSTATEKNNHGFAIERSSDNETWTEIGFIRGAGNSNIPLDYRYTDSAIAAAGTVYYRLHQIDRDGSSEYSSVAVVKGDAVRGFRITDAYPNPFNPSTTVSFTLNESASVDISLVDAAGRKVKAVLSRAALQGGTHTVTLNAGNLPSGRYLVVLQTAEDHSIYPVVLMK